MTDTEYDRSGAARQALEYVHTNFGPSGIDDGKMLNTLLPDLLPGAPLEASLLQAAASAGVGGLLRDRFASMSPEAAVRDVAAILTTRNALDTKAATWVVSEYAHLLGHPVDVAVLSSDPIVPSQRPAEPAQTTIDTPAGAVAPSSPAGMPSSPAGAPSSPAGWPPTYGQPGTSPQPGFGQPGTSPQPGFGQQPGFTQQPGYSPSGTPPTTPFPAYNPQPGASTGSPQQFQPGFAAPTYSPTPMSPAGVGATSYPPVSGGGYGYPQTGPYPPAFGQQPPKSKLPLILGIVIGLLVVGGGVTAFLLLGKDNKPVAHGSTPPVSTPAGNGSTPPSTPPSSEPPSTAGQRPLHDLMPTDLDVDADCDVDLSADPGVIGIVTGYKCTEPSSSKMHDGFIEAYQFTDKHSLDTSLAAINKFVKFDPNDSANKDSCPPTSAHPGDLTWEIDKVERGQLECYVAKDDSCVYIWTDTADLTLFYAGADKAVSCATMDDWWQNDSGDAD